MLMILGSHGVQMEGFYNLTWMFLPLTTLGCLGKTTPSFKYGTMVGLVPHGQVPTLVN